MLQAVKLATASRQAPGQARLARRSRSSRRIVAPWSPSPPHAAAAHHLQRAVPLSAARGTNGSGGSGVADGAPPPSLDSGAKASHGASELPPTPQQPRATVWLLSAVVRSTSGRLSALPPVLLTWLLRVLSCARDSYLAPATWLAEAYEAVARGLGQLQPAEVAAVFMAVASLSTSAAADPTTLVVLPPAALTTRLYDRLAAAAAAAAAGGGPGALDPRDALGCLEAAAAAACALEGQRGGSGAGQGPRGDSLAAAAGAVPLALGAAGQVDLVGAAAAAWGSGPGAGQGPSGPSLLQPPMPSVALDALLRAAGALLPPAGTGAGAGVGVGVGGGPAAQAAALVTARAACAAARLPSPPSAPVVADLAAALVARGAALVPEGPPRDRGGAAAPGGRSPGPPASLLLYLNALTAAGMMAAPPLPEGSAAAAGLSELLASRALPHLAAPGDVCRAVAAAQQLLPHGAALAVRGAGVRTLVGLLPGLGAAELTDALCALPAAPLAPPGQEQPPPRPSPPSASPEQQQQPALQAQSGYLSAPPPPPAPLALPPELAEAAHARLRALLPTAEPEALVELLRVLAARDGVPGFGWQGGLAAELGARLQGAAPPRPPPVTLASLAGPRRDAAPSAAEQQQPAPAAAALPPPAAAPPSPAELTNALYVLAALSYRPPGFGWTAAAAAALQPALPTLSPGQLTNALWALVRFGHRVEEPRGRWAGAAVAAVQRSLGAVTPNQLAYCLGCLQRLGCHVEGAVLDEMLDSVVLGAGGGEGGAAEAGAGAGAGQGAGLSPPGAAARPAASPADLVLLLVTVARLGHVPRYAFTEAVTERLRPHLDAAAAAGVAAAEVAGALGAQRGGERGAAGAGGVEDGPGDVRLVRVVVAGGPPGPGSAAAPLSAQELGSVGYALAKLHSRPEPEWMSAYLAAVRACLPAFPPDLLATTLWAVAELGQTPDASWLSAVLSASRPLLPAFAPRDLVSLLSCLASLRCPPPADWLGEALTVLGARVGGLDGAGVGALLKALVDLDARVSNPQWYDALCGHVGPWLPLLSAEQLVELVGALGALGHTPGREWAERVGAAALRVVAQAGGGAGVPGAAAAADNGPAAAGLTGAGVSARGLSAEQLEQLVCGLAKLGGAPPAALLKVYFASSAPLLEALPPPRLTAVASALAGSQPPVRPDPDWLAALSAAVRADVMSYSMVQLDALARAVAVFVEAGQQEGGGAQGRQVDEADAGGVAESVQGGRREGAGAEERAASGGGTANAAAADLLAFLREFCLYG